MYPSGKPLLIIGKVQREQMREFLELSPAHDMRNEMTASKQRET
jgi:hypothetical protein